MCILVQPTAPTTTGAAGRAASRRSQPHAGGARSRATLPFARPSASSMRSMSTTRRRDAADEAASPNTRAPRPCSRPHGELRGRCPLPRGPPIRRRPRRRAPAPPRVPSRARTQPARRALPPRGVRPLRGDPAALLSRWTGEYLSRHRHRADPVVTIPTDATAGDALDLLARRNILSAPITDVDALLVRGASLPRAPVLGGTPQPPTTRD